MKTWGNKDILKQYKTAFLCSQKCPAHIVLKSYDWAKQQRKEGNCIVCGNHSQIEKDVFEILLRGKQPLILVLARGMKKRWEPEIIKAVEENRLLVVTPFDENVKRVSRITAKKKNETIIELGDSIVVGYATEGGQLEELLKGMKCDVL